MMKKHAELVRRNFSYSAKTYDKIATMQRSIADELLTRIHNVSGSSALLDIGMGTGYLLQMLHLRYPDARLFGCDYAYGMVRQAHEKKISARLLQADAQMLPFSDGVFDAAVSNVTYQWVPDLAKAFLDVCRVLKSGAPFYFSVFSENTLSELRQTLLQFIAGDSGVRISALPNHALIVQMLGETGFGDIEVEYSRSRSYYKYLGELLLWLKQIGVNRFLPRQLHRGLSARGFLASLSEEYNKHYSEDGKVFATFEVLYVRAKKM